MACCVRISTSNDRRGKDWGSHYSLHGSKPRLHPHHPLHRLPIFIAVIREADFVVFVEPFAEIELDRCALENPLRLAARLVYDGGNAAIRCVFSQLLAVISRTEAIRLILRNQSSFCVFLEMSMWCAVYLTPSSSSVTLILWPLGVPSEYLI